MEKETELTAGRKSTEKKPLQPLPQSRKTGLFKLPQPNSPPAASDDDNDDDDDDNISLKEWAPTESKPPAPVLNGASYSAWQPVTEKGGAANDTPLKNVRTYAPLVESNGEVCLPPSIHMLALPKLHKPREDEDEDEEEEEEEEEEEFQEMEDHDDVESDTESAKSSQPAKLSHHQHNISLSNGIAPQPNHPTGGIAFDISLEDHDDSKPRRSTGSSRGSSLRVSFINEVVLDSPSPPRQSSKSPFRSRPSHSKSPAKSKPGWDSSAKIGKPAPPMPKKFVRPTLHGIKVKKGQGGVAKNALRTSTSALDHENGFGAREGRSTEPVARSWDPPQHAAGGEYDSVSQLISKSFIQDTIDKPNMSPLRAENGGEVLKSKDNGHHESNKLGGDFTKLFSKALRRASLPLSKPPSSKSPKVPVVAPVAAPLVGKIARANSTPVNTKSGKKTLAPLHSLDTGGANQKYAIGSYASLKLLQECAQTEKIAPTPGFNAHKPKKIRDHEPHRHYYKTISKTLDSKLKS